MINFREIKKDSAYDILMIRIQPFQPKLRASINFLYIQYVEIRGWAQSVRIEVPQRDWAKTKAWLTLTENCSILKNEFSNEGFMQFFFFKPIIKKKKKKKKGFEPLRLKVSAWNISFAFGNYCEKFCFLLYVSVFFFFFGCKYSNF